MTRFAVFGFFLLTYLASLWFFLFIAGVTNRGSHLEVGGLSKGVGPGANKWLALLALLSLTGLPPFALFFAKLGLLGLIAQKGSWGLLGVALSLILLGWVLYITSAVRLLTQAWPTTTPKAWLGPSPVFLLSLLFILLWGWLWLGDCWVLLSWAVAFHAWRPFCVRCLVRSCV